jgi:hypothetical protein
MCKQKTPVMDGHKIAIKFIDLINQYFYRSKHKLWLSKQINPGNPYSVLNKISLANSFVFLQISPYLPLLSLAIFKSRDLRLGLRQAQL